MALKIRLFRFVAGLFSFSAGLTAISCGNIYDYDIIVVGGSTSGTSAAIQAARSGADVLLVEQGDWLGGMLTSAGVSATDGCYKLRGGIWDEFRDSLEVYYGGPEALKTGWVSNVMFEPSVGNRIFQNMASSSDGLDVMFRTGAVSFEKLEKGGWTVLLSGPEGSSEVSAKILVDATELGDVAAAVGIPYNIGMDSKNETGEDIAPEQKNGIVQDLTYVLTVKEFDHPVPIPEPDDYSPSEFACCCDNPVCSVPKERNRVWPEDMMISYGKLPGGKYMLNWPIEGNDYYCNPVEMSPEERFSVLEEAKQRSLRYLYFIQNELGMTHLGLCDEYPTDDGFPFILYYRESRRINGLVRFGLNHITEPYLQENALYRTAVAVGDYPVDQHHTRYSGWESLPDLYFHAIPSYGLPAGVMMPCIYDDFIVIEKSISVTNVVNGSTRLQPVVLQLGQAAGVLAAQAVEKKCAVKDVSLRSVQSELLDLGTYLLPLLDLPAEDSHFKVLQRIGLTGILKCEGLTEGWENQTWFHADKTVSEYELMDGVREFYSELREAGAGFPDFSGFSRSCSKDIPSDVEFLSAIIDFLRGGGESSCKQEVLSLLKSEFGRSIDENSALTRLECAYVIDRMLDPFSYEVDVYGNLMSGSVI